MRSESKMAILAVAGLIALFAGTYHYARRTHERDCEGARTGRCGWAWCKYYDGSDYLHDFNF